MREVWRGSVMAWECDEMAHMNTRFYVARAMEGLAGLFGYLGMPRLFAPSSPTTIAADELHIRFWREARMAAPLHMTGGVVGVGNSEADVLLLLYHSRSGQIAATFRLRVSHVVSADGRTRKDWPAAMVAAANALRTEVPPEARPRTVSVAPVESKDTLDHAEELGLRRAAMSFLAPEGCDPFGRMQQSRFIGAVGDGVRHLLQPLRDIVAENADTKPKRYGGAALEFRVVNFERPVSGDCYEVRSGLQKVEGSAFSVIHWMLDPFTGKRFASMQSINTVLDLDARKIVPISGAARQLLSSHAIPGLRL
jgi:acyl-CoA thioester hydrolase